ILDVGARIVQLDTPEEILTNPAEDFVVDFIGKGAALKTLTLTRVGDADLKVGVTAKAGESTQEVVDRARTAGEEYVVILDGRGRPRRWQPRGELTGDQTLSAAADPDLPTLSRRATLNEALDTMLVASQNGVIVTGKRDTYLGYLTIDTVMSFMTDLTGATAASPDSSASPDSEEGA
ncbi:MAG TPA: ABC transporter, partial [Ruania sp.]|nr:ABC transporter [Ruania sp.]